jgi:hypothetical protein
VAEHAYGVGNPTTLEDESLEQCLRKVYEGLIFPEARHNTDASYPYRFMGSGE